MREIRLYGSEGGVAGKPAIPTPIAPALRDAGGPASLRSGRGLLPAGSRRSRWAAMEFRPL